MHTHFTGTPSERHVFMLGEMTRPDVQNKLRALWQDPDAYKPKRTNRDITEQAARTFAGTAERLRAAGIAPPVVSHFLTQCLFCFFAEDVGLLPARLFERLVGVAVTPEQMRVHLGRLFETMRDGGLFGVDGVPWFNGGLFRVVDVPAFAAEDVTALKAASSLNWSAVDPSLARIEARSMGSIVSLIELQEQRRATPVARQVSGFAVYSLGFGRPYGALTSLARS